MNSAALPIIMFVDSTVDRSNFLKQAVFVDLLVLTNTHLKPSKRTQSRGQCVIKTSWLHDRLINLRPYGRLTL